MTLVEARKADGTLVGRCDARCYDANGPRCGCICGGRHHGVGLSQVREITRNPDPGFRRSAKSKAGGGRVMVRVMVPPIQLELFPKETP